MAQIIPEGYGFVARGDRTRREVATDLLARADKAGVDPTSIRVTNGGYYVPEELLSDADKAAAEPEAEESGAPAKNAAKADWVAYASEQGYDESEGLTKDELIERYGD